MARRKAASRAPLDRDTLDLVDALLGPGAQAFGQAIGQAVERAFAPQGGGSRPRPDTKSKPPYEEIGPRQFLAIMSVWDEKQQRYRAKYVTFDEDSPDFDPDTITDTYLRDDLGESLIIFQGAVILQHVKHPNGDPRRQAPKSQEGAPTSP